MKNWIITLLAICFIVTGCMKEEKTITSIQMKDIFEKQGILLAEPKGLHPDNVFLRTLNDVRPETFTLNESQLISIYFYSSSNEAKKGIKDFEDKTATADVVAHSKYQIANVLLFYVAERSSKDDRVELVIEDMKNLVQ